MQERVKQLEKERAILMSREEKITSRDTEKDLQREEERRTLIASLGEFRQRYAVLEDENDNLRNGLSRMKHEHGLITDERDNAHEQIKGLQEELQSLDDENRKLKASEEDLRKAQERVQDLEKQLQERRSLGQNGHESASSPVSEVLRKELHHQVQHLRTLEQNNGRLTKELATLKKDKVNVELLKEEKLSLESKVRRMDALRRTLAETEAEVAVLQRERDEWAVYLKDSQNDEGSEKFESPAQLARSLASAKIEIASLKEKLESSAANLRLRDELMQKLEARVQELEREILPKWKGETETLQRRLENVERMRSLDKRELGMLREQIQSYSIEESQLMASTSSRDGDVKPNVTAYDDQKTLQIRHLQELLEAQKTEAGRVAKELDQALAQLQQARNVESDDASNLTAKQESLRQTLSDQIARNEVLQESLRLTQKDLAEMHNELEALDIQLDALKHALGRGEYNPETTKVLSLRDNPADMDFAIRTETLDRLKEENRVLLEKLEEAEKQAALRPTSSSPVIKLAPAHVHDGDSVPKQTYLNLQAENEELQGKIEQGEKARNRLREVFQKTARELREACKSLLGYTLEPVENGRMKLTTVFGGSDYQLVFGPGQSTVKGQQGKLQLVGGNEAFITSPRVQQGLHFWVAERGCLPGFLASMTLELFEESTRGRTVGYMEG